MRESETDRYRDIGAEIKQGERERDIETDNQTDREIER